MKNQILLIFLSLMLSGNVISQTRLEINLPVGENNNLPRSVFPASRQSDSVSVVRSLNKMLASLYDRGYLAASIDSIKGNKDTIQVFLVPGEKYQWRKLKNGNLDEGMLSEAGFREKLYDEVPLKPDAISKLNKKILGYCENHGYPFANLRYENFTFEKNLVAAEVFLNKDKLITIDSVLLKGKSKLSATYLYSYLSVEPGDIYNESIIRKISNRLKELPMVLEVRPFNVAFTDENARLILYLDDKKASQVDGIIGILPDNNKSGKVQVTGDLRIRLLSSFGQGELLDLNWKQPQAKTQDLKIKINYPFIFSTPFGIDLNLGIYKKDTSYLEVVLGGGVQFLLKGGNYLKVFVNDKKSTLLSTAAFEYSTVLPSFADIRVTSYGIGYKSMKLDYRLNPRKGYNLEFNVMAGNKKITKNIKLNQELYDSLKLKSVQYNGEIIFDYYIPFFARSVINLGVSGGGLSGESGVTFDNELFRIGGLKTLRGFDEESITASLYAIGKIEFRYLLEQNSNLFLFYNSSWYERYTQSDYISDQPSGFGAGINFETKLGIFSFSYALGKEFNNAVRIKAAKIHFGLVNYF